MTIVAGVDFGTLSVRVTLVDSQKGPIGTASAPQPLEMRSRAQASTAALLLPLRSIPPAPA